jgi:hypothetical protein
MAKKRIVFLGDINNAVGAEKENDNCHAPRSNQGLTTEKIGRVSVVVNGRSYAYPERQAYAAHIKRYLLDDIDITETQAFLSLMEDITARYMSTSLLKERARASVVIAFALAFGTAIANADTPSASPSTELSAAFKALPAVFEQQDPAVT